MEPRMTPDGSVHGSGACAAATLRSRAPGTAGPGSLTRPRRPQVKIPGTLVDGLVVARPENHWMSYVTAYNAGHASEIKAAAAMHPLPMDERKVLRRSRARAAAPAPTPAREAGAGP